MINFEGFSVKLASLVLLNTSLRFDSSSSSVFPRTYIPSAYRQHLLSRSMSPYILASLSSPCSLHSSGLVVLLDIHTGHYMGVELQGIGSLLLTFPPASNIVRNLILLGIQPFLFSALFL